MRTRSRSHNNFPQQEASRAIVKPLRIELPFLEDQFQEYPLDDPPEVLMADNRTMAKLLQAPTEEDPHAHIRYFNKITSTMRVPNVPSSSIKLMLFTFSLEGAAQIWLDKEPPRSILTWDDLVTKFINQFFHPSKTTNLRNEITRFQQRFDESFYEAWDRFNDLLRACPHHGFFKLHQLDTFYNALNINDHDSLNSAAVIAKVSTSSSTPAISSDVAELKDMVRALLLDKKNQSSAPAHSPTPAPVKAVEPNSVTCGANYNQGNASFRPQMVANQIRPPGFPPHQNNQNNFNRGNNFNQNRGGNFNQGQLHRPQVNQPPAYQAPAYQAPIPQIQSVSKTDFESYVKDNDAVLKNMQNQCQNLQIQMANLTDMLSKFMSSNIASSSGSGTLPSNTITNPKEDLKGITTRSGVAYQGPTIPTPSKVVKQGTELSEMARTLINEHCSAVILNKLPRKLGDPDKFLIPCEFPGMDECLALANLGTSINLMPLFVLEGLSLLELTLTRMTLELADCSVYKPIGIAKVVSVKVGVFYFPADFMVVDFEPDPRAPLILGRCFLKTDRALIDVHKCELTLRIGNDAITYNLDQTARYSANYNQMTGNKIDVIDMACEEYSQEVLSFSDVTVSGNPTPYDDPIVSTTSPTLTLFGDNDFLLFEEANAFLGLEDDPNSPEFNPFYYDLEGDILLLKTILKSEPLPPFPNHEQYMPSFKKELKVYEAKIVKSSVDEPPEVELKDLPLHLEYAFLEGDNKLPVIIAKELGDEEKSALIKVLKSHKRAIAWKLSDIQGINPKFSTHKILMEEDYKPAVQHQRRVNPKIHNVIKKEVEKILDAGLIYLISDSPWVSPVHCVPKKGGFTIVKNEENELIPTRLVIGWRVCIDYRKLNEATRKYHFPLPFMDQMLERLAGNEYYCFLDGFSRYFQIPIDPRDQEKTTFTCLYRTFAYRCMPFGLCNAPGTFQRCMLAIFHDMVQKTMEVFMEDFSIFGNSFENSLSRLDKMLQRCEDTNLCLNWEKSHFMVKEGIVLSHKISKNGIEVGKAKVDLIAKLPRPTTVKGAVLGQRHEKHFRPIHYASKMMTDAESNYTTTEKEMLAVVESAPIEEEHLDTMLGFVLAYVECPTDIKRPFLPYRDAIVHKTPIGCTPYKLVYGKDCSDCEVSRALSFFPSFTRSSHPQLHFGNP
nr:reverse transcriptase domain-containing protein [Tanacetum cinerariifolium]